MQPDPSRSEANLFVYAGNNPVGLVDPTGLEHIGLLNYNEIRFCALVENWYNCAVAASLSGVASTIADQIFPNSGPNGRQDAMRHCLWQSCLARTLGVYAAAEFGYLHEAFPGNPIIWRAMDLYNNYVARSFARFGQPYKVKTFVSICFLAVAAGWLARDHTKGIN